MAICGNPDCKARYDKPEFASSFHNWCNDECRNIITQAKQAKSYAKNACKLASAKSTTKKATNQTSVMKFSTLTPSTLKASKSAKARTPLKNKTPLKGTALGSAAYNKEKRVRDAKRKVKVAENKLGKFIPKMTIKEAKAAAVKICHLFIRTRDKGKPCPCCNEPLGDDYQAGHFIASGSCSYLMFDERNIHGQRYLCNMFKEGDSGLYDPNLRLMLGSGTVDEMLSIADRNPVVKRSLADYMAIIDYYTDKLAKLLAKQECPGYVHPEDLKAINHL